MAELRTDTLLVELGCEDLPAGSIEPMAEHMGQSLHARLAELGLAGGAPQVFATPRRIAAQLPGVGQQQAASEQVRRGPALAAAYDESGAPSRALQGFLRSVGAEACDLQTLETDKGAWVVLKQRVPGLALSDALAEALPEILRALPVPRRMRWSDHEHEFLRPVEWLVALHGTDVLSLELLGLAATRNTRGHRFHNPGPLSLASADDYEKALRDAHVEPSFARRQSLIVEQVNREASQLGGQALMEPPLLDEVTALVEWPVAVAGRFDPSFLEIPKEALIQTMQDNQRYFAVLDANGELMPAFIAVANLESKDPAVIIDGNERVIRPRFADTMFFWNQDKARTLASFAPELASVQFQKALGSVADKAGRIASLAVWLAPQLGAGAGDVEQAAQLCKCDLVSEIVRELPSMQGIAGRYYAARDGLSALVSEAMEQHYYPRQAGGLLPEGTVSQAVALADKADTLAGVFGIGLLPTGTKDPYALRRAALGVVRILVEREHEVNLHDLFSAAAAGYTGQGAKTLTHHNMPELVQFALERLRVYLHDQGVAADVLDAVLARARPVPLDIHRRSLAVSEFRDSDAAGALSAASKRAANLLRKVDEALPTEVDATLFEHASESALYESLQQHSGAGQHARSIDTPGVDDYREAMTGLACLREPVDRFFEDVMVMIDDAPVRRNRLALLDRLHTSCTAVADVALLQSEPS